MFPVWRNGVVAGAFSIFRDVTELNRLGMEVERITQVAEDVERSGARLLRGGAFKPRTSPYAFQGLEEEGCATSGGPETRPDSK